MQHFEEKVISGLRIRIDRTLCVGFGDCLTEAPDVLELDDEGIAVFRADATDIPAWRLLDACNACPVDALTAFDADGKQLVP